MTTVKPSHKLTFRDRLSQLNFEQARKLLGKDAKRLIHQGAKFAVDLKQDVYLGGDLLRVTFRDPDGRVQANATLTMSAEARDRLLWNCDLCRCTCEHVGALFSIALEDKMELGLSAAPAEREIALDLTEEELVARATKEREERAAAERMKIKPADASTPWTDYHVTSLVSGKSYRVALRGLAPGESYCSCPDFRTNTLGTCKHVIKVTSSLKRKFDAKQLKRSYKRKRIEVHLRYDGDVSLRLSAPEKLDPQAEAIIRPLLDRPIENVVELMKRLHRLEAAEQEFHIFPDAEEYIQQQLHQERIRGLVAAIRKDPGRHPLRTSLLKIPLLPYQLDGIAFVVGAGRAVLADDMGLGKTMQGVGVAELLAREAGIKKVLVVCPASLKSQWRNEIARFCGRESQLIAGRTAERTAQYTNDCFYTICNYEQVLKDILSIEQTPWDLIILDEGQRIKNWESKTTRVVKGLKSRFALVLSGTPLENRLDELYSVVQFIDDRRLGPGFRFFHRHRILDEKGKVLGYKHLDQLRAALAPVLLRRTRDSVKLELPERSDEIVRIPPTEEQVALHDAHMKIVASIVRKPYITEMDLLRLRAALLACRMSADGTYLVTKENPNWSSKLDRLAEIFDDLADETSRKVVLFSEWTTMLDLIEPLLKKRKLRFVRLDGNVPQKKRQALVHEFQNDPECRFFITTNAGSTGLNLQAANTVINVDLPWNPAVLEQRIARAYRMGQQRAVQVLILVTEGTLEESLLNTLSAKRDLALAALDPLAEATVVDMQSGSEELKSRLEILLGAKAEAPLDQTAAVEAQQTIERSEHRERVSAAGGELLGAAFKFLGELISSTPAIAPPPDDIVNNIRGQLQQCIEVDDAGRARFSVTLPNKEALDGLAKTLSQLLVVGAPGQ
jgi:hypothetical protein